MTTDRRPLSPHLQVYRPQITSVLSITHRGTGLVLALGSILLAYWLSAVAGGAESFAVAQGILGSIPGRLVLLAVTYSFFYHFCNGIRHLFWDSGRGIDMVAATRSGWAVIVASVVLTVIAFLVGYGVLGGAA